MNIIFFLLKPQGWIAKLLLVVLLFGFGYLFTQGHLARIEEILDSDAFALSIGGTRISAYTITAGIVLVLILFWVTGLIADLGKGRIAKIQNLHPSNKTLLTKAFQIGVYCIAFFLGIEILGIDLTIFAFLAGAIGIGVGFGLQKITSNFISGIILLLEKSISDQDLIELSDGTFGFVKHMGARYTLLSAADGKEIMIPNEEFITSRVNNWTYGDQDGRVDIAIGVSYDCDLEKARSLILEAMCEHPLSLKEPAPSCFLSEFADSSVNFNGYFWVGEVHKGRFAPKSEVLFAIWRKFKDNNIVIPYPRQDITITNETPGS